MPQGSTPSKIPRDKQLCHLLPVQEFTPFPTPNSAVPHKMQITAAGLSGQLGSFPVTVQIVLLLSVPEWCKGLEPTTPWNLPSPELRFPVADQASQQRGKRVCISACSVLKTWPRNPCTTEPPAF